jgi:hypothetical protein
MTAGPSVTTREDADHQREHHLGARLGRRFFGALAALGAQRLGVDAQRLRHARSELVGLDQHRDERRDVVDSGPPGEVVQRLATGGAGPELEVDESELIAQVLVSERQLFGHALKGLIEPKARFHAHDEQIERIGQPEADAMLPPFSHAREDHAGQHVRDCAHGQRQQQTRPPDEGR